MTPPPSDIRVALIGFGLAGELFHAPLIATTPGMRLATVVTSNPVRAQRAAQSYAGAQVVSSVEPLWDRKDLDVVVIATPNRTHGPLAERALEAGLAVVVDKPFAPTAHEARLLVEHARRSGLLLTVYQNRRWDGDFLTLRRLLDGGRLGTVHRFESRFERWRPVPKPGWRQDSDPAAAGGVLYDLGSHLIDQAVILFGEVKQVYAEVDSRVAGSAVDDDAFVALTHRSGVTSHLWMSTAAAQSGPRFRALGSNAAFTKYGLDVQESALRSGTHPDAPEWGAEAPERWGVLGTDDEAERVRTEPGTYPHFYRQVGDALRRGAPPPVDPWEAVTVIEIIEAARRSAEFDRLVVLP